MEEKEKIKEEKEQNGVMLGVGITVLILSIIGFVFIKSLEFRVISGFFIGSGIALLILAICLIINCNKRLNEIEVKEMMVNQINEREKEFNQADEVIRIIYQDLRFRDEVLKNKFGRIKNKKLRQDFLSLVVDYERNCFDIRKITIEDIIEEFKDFYFKRKDFYKKFLFQYEEKQKVLDEYAKGKKDVNND